MWSVRNQIKCLSCVFLPLVSLFTCDSSIAWGTPIVCMIHFASSASADQEVYTQIRHTVTLMAEVVSVSSSSSDWTQNSAETSGLSLFPSRLCIFLKQIHKALEIISSWSILKSRTPSHLYFDFVYILNTEHICKLQTAYPKHKFKKHKRKCHNATVLTFALMLLYYSDVESVWICWSFSTSQPLYITVS